MLKRSECNHESSPHMKREKRRAVCSVLRGATVVCDILTTLQMKSPPRPNLHSTVSVAMHLQSEVLDCRHQCHVIHAPVDSAAWRASGHGISRRAAPWSQCR